MEEIIIYKYQLETIENTLRLIGNTWDLRKGESCLGRDFNQSEAYVKNALEGNHKEQVSRFIKPDKK